MDNGAKLRPILLAKILYERTDYDHYLTTSQLATILEDEYGVKGYRTTIASDIELLQNLGMDIQVTKSSQNLYNVLGRYFNDAELRMMIDAVASSRFITTEESEKIIKKIGALAGKNAAQKMVRNVSVERRIKNSNTNVVNIIDCINEAINQKKQITFQYFEYNVKKERQPRFDGYWYKFSPYRLVWNGDFYYVVGFYEKYKKIMSYRVDRIVSVPRILEADSIPMPENFDLDQYLNTMYHMFSTQRRTVELICNNDVMDSIIDRFGENVVTYAYDMENFRADVEVAVNAIFYSWIFGFKGKVKIKAPEDVKEGFTEMVADTYKSLAGDESVQKEPEKAEDEDIPF